MTSSFPSASHQVCAVEALLEEDASLKTLQTAMDLNIRAAQEALANPSEQVLETMRGASSEAQAAVASVAPRTSALASIPASANAPDQIDAANAPDAPSAAGPAGASAVLAADTVPTEQEDTSRLQVVDEVNSFQAHEQEMDPVLTLNTCYDARLLRTSTSRRRTFPAFRDCLPPL